MKQELLASIFYILPHHAISWVMFKSARIQWAPLKNLIIRIYTDLNPVKMHEAIEENMFAYESLNAFFTRALKSECRPFDKNEKNWLCPVDGSVSQAQGIKDGRIFQAKGHDYSLDDLLATDLQESSHYVDGEYATIYLAPYNYHRVHAPFGGKLVAARFVPGDLFSVNAATAANVPGLRAASPYRLNVSAVSWEWSISSGTDVCMR